MAEIEAAHAYIDGANLDKGVKALGWKISHWRFRSWIRQKYGVTNAYLFIGLIPAHADLYASLTRAGFRLVFKEVLYTQDGSPKGNCDADLVLRAVRDVYEYDVKQVILVTSDGDYASLVKFWQEKGVRCTILSPSTQKRCSWLLRKANVPIVYLEDVQHKIEMPQNEKAPGTDVSVQGPLSS